MTSSENETESIGTQSGIFATTHWSVVLAAGQQESPQVAEALEQLCRIYWYPLYAYVRRRGYGHEDAQDLTQAFFARFLEKRYLHLADATRGKFRSFLLTALKHFLADEWDKLRAEKRGGERVPVFLDDPNLEARYHLEPVDRMDAERIYERRWAITLLNQVLDHLAGEFARAGKTRVFEQLQPLLLGEKSAVTYAAIAAELELTESAVKVTVHRMRQRYRKLFREEIEHTVADSGEVDEEMRHLLAVIGA